MPSHKTIATPSGDYRKMEEWRKLPRLLMAGTRELRKEENAREWLPPWDDEENQHTDSAGREITSEWMIRVRRTVIDPYFRRAVQRSASAILAKPIVLEEDVPLEIRGTEDADDDGWWSNIDLEGNDGDQFFSRVAEESLGDAGMSFILVEHQPVPPEATNATMESLGLRPYCIHVKPSELIFWDPETVQGRKRLREIRRRETYKRDDDGKEDVQIRQIVAAPVGSVQFARWQLHRKADRDDTDSWFAVPEEEGGSGTMQPHRDIPLVAYYTGYESWMKAKCPFEDLAYLNMLHTQRQSDIDENERISLGAQLHRSGISIEDASKQRAIGAKRLLVTEDPNGKAEWLERTGAASRVAIEHQDRLEARMLSLSHEPHVRRTGTETATGRAIDAAEARTEVQAWALALQDTVKTVLDLLAAYRGHASGGTVRIDLPPRVTESDVETLKLMATMSKELGAPRPETILTELKRQNRLPEDLDVDREVEIASGIEPGVEGRARAMLRPVLEQLGLTEEQIDVALDQAQDKPPV